MSLLQAYHIFWKVDVIIINNITGVRGDEDLPGTIGSY
jgi:hypothetical protein